MRRAERLRHPPPTVALSVSLAAVLSLAVAPRLARAGDFPDPEPPTLDADSRERLEDGEIVADVEKNGRMETRLLGLVDAPPEVVWHVIDDYDGQKEWVPGMLDSSKVLRREGEQKVCRTGLDLPWPLANRTYRVRVENHETRIHGRRAFVSRWTHVEGSGNIDAVEGYWLLLPWSEDRDRTLVKQVTRLDLGVAVPDFLIRRGARRRLPAVMEALRERVRRRR